jgi:hypothetical protein
LVTDLRREQQHALQEGPLVEHGADPDEWRAAMNGLSDRIELGESYVEHWRSCVHGEIDDPQAGQGWKEWHAEIADIATSLKESRTFEDRMYDEWEARTGTDLRKPTDQPDL